jgi:DNA-binding transcriptional MerR regulator
MEIDHLVEMCNRFVALPVGWIGGVWLRYAFFLEPNPGSDLMSFALKGSALASPSTIKGTAAETARRLGLTVRALRIYESYGLVRPRRTAAGWRIFVAEDVARLHQVIALKRLGLKLSQIALLMKGAAVDLDTILEVQEQVLLRHRRQAERALALVRRARKELAQGRPLAMDDLIALTKETAMADFAPTPEFQALVARHTNKERVKEVHPEWTAEDQARINKRWPELFAEADRLKDGDPGSPQALDLGRRWIALAEEFTKGDPELTRSLLAIYREGFSDPQLVRHMPFSAEVQRFINEVFRRLKGTVQSGGKKEA